MRIESILKEKRIIAATKLEDIELAVNSRVGAIILMNLKLNQILKRKISEYNKIKPIILAGLINSRVHIENAFIHGANGVSLSNKKFWNL